MERQRASQAAHSARVHGPSSFGLHTSSVFFCCFSVCEFINYPSCNLRTGGLYSQYPLPRGRNAKTGWAMATDRGSGDSAGYLLVWCFRPGLNPKGGFERKRAEQGFDTRPITVGRSQFRAVRHAQAACRGRRRLRRESGQVGSRARGHIPSRAAGPSG